MHRIGIAIGGTKSAVTFAEIDENEIKIIEKINIKTNPESASETYEKLVEAIDSRNFAFDSISVICGGPLDPIGGTINKPANLPGFDNFPIVKLLNDRYSKPVSLLNDADACALAEYKYGVGKGLKNFVYITFGTGLGCGLILNGRLYSGTNAGAGEIGHVRIKSQGHFARNGKKGSSESFASGGGISDLSLSYFETRKSAKEIFDLARKGDEKAKKIVSIVATSLGQVVSTCVDLFNPECIAIGGIYPRVIDVLQDKMMKTVRKESLPMNLSSCKILPCSLQEKIDEYSSLMEDK